MTRRLDQRAPEWSLIRRMLRKHTTKTLACSLAGCVPSPLSRREPHRGSGCDLKLLDLDLDRGRHVSPGSRRKPLREHGGRGRKVATAATTAPRALATTSW
jgi:hypothetical protein